MTYRIVAPNGATSLHWSIIGPEGTLCHAFDEASAKRIAATLNACVGLDAEALNQLHDVSRRAGSLDVALGELEGK